MSEISSSWHRVFRSKSYGPSMSYCRKPEEFLGGNRLALLRDGREAYPAMLEAIAGARKTVHVETYKLLSDEVGWKFARLLAQKSRSGVAVRVIFDSIGSLGITEEYLQFLRNQGISFLEYHPVAPWRRRWGWGRRDHRKILVVDSGVGFAGGLNISGHGVSLEEGGHGWRDADVRVEGPCAYELDRLFRTTWFRETGKWFKLDERPQDVPGPSFVQVASNAELIRRHNIRRAYRHALKRAQRSVCIANAYFAPDRGIRRALYKAVRRGVAIRVLMPGKSDVPAAAYASRRLYEDLLRHGVRLFEWPGSMLHAKMVAIDGIWSAVGSYNLNHRSWLHDLEVNLHVLDPEFGRKVEETFEQDLKGSTEITLGSWLARPLRNKILERAFYWARYWL